VLKVEKVVIALRFVKLRRAKNGLKVVEVFVPGYSRKLNQNLIVEV
jgi:hypothetical protein